ncbi:DNA topoisomerase, partial (macronuclear) [Tetrahymena thermophila SB210]
DNIIGDEGASGLGSALANCINLSNLTLELDENQIGAMGASGLGSALANCINLSNLTLNL